MKGVDSVNLFCMNCSMLAHVMQVKMAHLIKTLLEVAYAMRHLHSMHRRGQVLKQQLQVRSSKKMLIEL